MHQRAAEPIETLRLLERAETGDRDAFDQLFGRHRAYLRKVIALRLHHGMRARVDPSDIVQETQIEAYRRLPDYLSRRPMGFRLWLRRTACERVVMARRFHLDAARRAASREVPLPDGSSFQLVRPLLANSSPSQSLLNRERAKRIREAMARLSESDRELLIMRNLEELSNREAAEALGIDPAAASQRYGRALLRLRKILVACGLIESES